MGRAAIFDRRPSCTCYRDRRGEAPGRSRILTADTNRAAISWLFGRRHLAAHLFARALRNVLPFGRVVVGLRTQSGACVLGRAAVVLSGFGNAETLLGAAL